MNSDRLSRVRGLISLARPANVLVGVLGVLACGLIADTASTDWTLLLLAATGAGLLTAAANTINDVFDVATDRINKPRRAIAAGHVSRSAARRFSLLLCIAGLAVILPSGLLPFVLAVAAAALMYTYSARLKQRPFIGNLTVGLITAMAFPFGCAAAGDIAAGLIPAIFALLFSIGREIIKDAEDIEGDTAAGITTLATREGAAGAVHAAGLFFFLVILASPFPYLYDVYSRCYMLSVLLGVDVVLLGIMLYLWHDSSRKRLARASVILKVDMLVGVGAIVLGKVC